MYDYIQIANINDFIFCPRSIYFHNCYQKYEEHNFKDKPQVVGTLKHENIDNEKYSTSKNILQSMPVYSEKFKIAGKIDIFDKKKGFLVERKNKIKKIYDGYILQVYAQYFCLKEMGYSVKAIFLHSLSDNKRYKVKLPQRKDEDNFSRIIKEINDYKLKSNFKQSRKKCEKCIYSLLCDFYH